MEITTNISICIPAYQAAKYVATAIESAISQTVPAREILVSNNWSTDDTAAVLSEYDGRVRLLQPPVHLSMSDHYRYLTEQARGEHVVLLDADNALHPKFVDAVAPSLNTHSMVATGRFECDCHLRPFGYSGLAYRGRRNRDPGALFTEFLAGCRYSQSGTAWDRQWLLSLPRLPKEAEYATDWYLGIVTAAYRPIAMLPVPRHYYRFHDGNASHSAPDRWTASARAMLQWLAAADLLSEQQRLQVRRRAEIMGSPRQRDATIVGFLNGINRSAREVVSWCACHAYRHPAYLR